jgi:hypothetical protein
MAKKAIVYFYNAFFSTLFNQEASSSDAMGRHSASDANNQYRTRA